MNNRKDRVMDMAGFTLVEVMVTLVIVTMLVGVIGSFLVMHLKSFEITKSTIDIQREAQLALNRMGKVAMESAGVYNVDDSSNPKVVVFKYDDEDHASNEKIIFTHEDGKLLFKVIKKNDLVPNDWNYDSTTLNSKWFVLADYVEDWTIEPYGDTFEDSTAINIRLDFKKNDAVITVNNSFKYRNKN